MKKRVYLCGPITGTSIERVTSERLRFAEYLEDRGIKAVTPLRGKELIHDGSTVDMVKHSSIHDPKSITKSIVNRDRNDVVTSDAVLADLRDVSRVSIGSMVEFGWADAFRIPIITIMDRDNIHDHGFVRELSTYVVEDPEEALYLTIGMVNP